MLNEKLLIVDIVHSIDLQQVSGTFFGKGIMKPTLFLIVFPWEPYNIFQHLMQLSY